MKELCDLALESLRPKPEAGETLGADVIRDQAAFLREVLPIKHHHFFDALCRTALRGEREGMVMMPKLETVAMQDAARGIIQILRARPGCTERDVYLHCEHRGDSTKGLHEHDGAYVTEARAVAMIYRAMLSARPHDERKE